MNRLQLRLLAATLVALAFGSPALAQDEDVMLRPAEPDVALVSLPTSLRLAPWKSLFRLTHRFGLPLEGDFGDLASNLFGLDNGATVGLEFRIGIVRNGQVGVHRSSDGKTIELFGQYGLLRQARGFLDISALFSIDGTNNFQDSYSPAIGAIVSRTVGEWVALYVEPIWVNNSNQQPSELVDDNDSFIVGLGARVRIRPTVYLVGEFAPRAAGYSPQTPHASFGIEKRAGGHMFQLNFSNSHATTPGQLARGGVEPQEWYMGFNLSRKFY